MDKLKYALLLISTVLLFLSCDEIVSSNSIYVNSINELNKAIQDAKSGDEIILANGTWQDAQINFYGMGTEEAPITLRAETPGKVFIEGQSFLHLGGEHLIVEGLYFRNGYTPDGGVIQYKIGSSLDSIAFHTRVTSCVIEGFTRPNRWENDRWVAFYGKYNQLDHSYLSGKSNDGETLRVFFTGNHHVNNHHQIVYNYFGPRPRKGGPRAEIIRVGDSETRLAPGYTNISHNYFDGCNGEVEIISDKTNFNYFTENIFDKCEGSLVLRHSNYATVDRNLFIGDDASDFYGGVRAVNTGHWVTNNYFYKINGAQFRSPLAIMNGIPRTPLNRYKQVADVVVAYNTWVDCKSPWQIGVGQNKASVDVLPPSEIRSAPPIRTTIANNLIYNTKADTAPVINHDDMSGISFNNNIIDNNGHEFTEFGVLKNESIKMIQINDWLFAPANNAKNDGLNNVYDGFEFEKIDHDLFGASRNKENRVGAISQLASAEKFKINKKQYGPKWFAIEKSKSSPNILVASSEKSALEKAIAQAQSGDIIELSDKNYSMLNSLKIDKEITIRSKDKNQVHLVFSGRENTPAFQMHPKGVIRLENVTMISKDQLAFAPLEKNMASAYSLFLDNCEINGFKYILKASKGSFADSIHIANTTFRNCKNGFVLAADEKGDYNAEMVTFDNCKFLNVQKNVIYFYRGGYDESTIGGNLKILNSSFIACGQREKSDVLIKTPGIINVLLAGNNFQKNPVKWMAILWGEKNNHHRNNTISQSGQIKVEAQHKLDILY